MAASCNRKISSNWPGRKASNIRGNVGSLKGFYGKSAAALAQTFRTRQLYEWWGTDSHNIAMAKRMPLKN